MTKYIGEITIVKTNMETGEVTEYTQKNTQLLGMFKNLSETATAPLFSNSASASYIYISDNNLPYNRLTYDIPTTAQTFNVGGAVIGGEYWPQYSLDTVLKRATFTFKQRFAPGASARVINSIALYAPQYGAYLAGLKLQTPCNQGTLDILDIYYKIYVYYDSLDSVNDYNLNNYHLIRTNLVSRWFYGINVPLYAEGTSTNITSNSGAWFNALSFMLVDSDLRDYTTSYNDSNMAINTSPWCYYTVTPTSTSVNNSQGTAWPIYNMTTSAFVGCIINKVVTPRWEYTNNSSYQGPISATYVLAPTDSRIQSVYLKSASSTSTNFAYLDPSTIGSSTATLTLNDTGWTSKWRPSMFKINITQGGGISAAKYTVSMRNSFGFANNFFNTERPIPLNNIYRRLAPAATSIYLSNTFNNRGYNIKRINNRTTVTSAPTGITIADVYLGNFTNYDATSTPALISSQIQDAIPMEDGSILITSLDKGLMKLSADRTSLTQFTGIGSGVSDNICYAACPKSNGDIWAMFEGGLARYTASFNTWTVYNSSTPITFTASTFNPNWSNTLALHCRKDAGGDAIALFAVNSTSITWWSPSTPTAVTTTANGNMARNNVSTFRADMSGQIISLPGTNTWFFPNYNGTMSRMTFGTNTATIVSAYTQGAAKPACMQAVMFNGEWTVQTFELSNSNTVASQIRWYNETSLVANEATNLNTTFNIYGSNVFVNELMDEYGTMVMCYTTITPYQFWLYNYMNPLSSYSWRNYGWNSGTSQWELNNTNSKPVHTTMDDLPDGLKCSFTPTGSNDFILNERWIGYVTDGLHKDNSTTAVLGTAVHGRNHYNTTDLSATTVPSTSLGATTEKFSAYTLNNSTAMSWNGAVSGAYYNSNSVVNSLRSELIVEGDFTFNFWTNPYAGSTSAGNTQCWIGFYENAAVTPTSKWAFRFNNSGYLVTEDDTAKTTNVAPTVVQKYTIKRVGSTITYLVNDVLIYTSTITSANPLRGIIRMPVSDNSRTFYDMSLTYNETRRVLKIGSPVNQTGVYDSNYAMIEGWLTTPQTISVTLDGVPATVITDPAVAPAAGQVLLLQKAGMLVFNSADAGKTVACNAMVLLET